MTPKQGLCMSDTTDFKKGGIYMCSCLMCACWPVCLCALVLIFAHISEMHGARTGSTLAGNTCFWLTWPKRGATELNSCIKETKRKVVCCCHPASEAQLGGKSTGQQGFYLFEARIAFKGPVSEYVNARACSCFKSEALRKGLCSNEQ